MNDFTAIKKMMTERIMRVYCQGHHNSSAVTGELCADCCLDLKRIYGHLDACHFKEKGWPCPTCPGMCYQGDDKELLMRVMSYAQEWMEEHPDEEDYLVPPVMP